MMGRYVSYLKIILSAKLLKVFRSMYTTSDYRSDAMVPSISEF